MVIMSFTKHSGWRLYSSVRAPGATATLATPDKGVVAMSLASQTLSGPRNGRVHRPLVRHLLQFGNALRFAANQPKNA
jgi:hypothetical protein